MESEVIVQEEQGSQEEKKVSAASERSKKAAETRRRNAEAQAVAREKEGEKMAPLADCGTISLQYQFSTQQWLLGNYRCKVTLMPAVKTEKGHYWPVLRVAVTSNHALQPGEIRSTITEDTWNYNGSFMSIHRGPDGLTLPRDYDVALNMLDQQKRSVELAIRSNIDLSLLRSAAHIRRAFTDAANGNEMLLTERSL